MNCYLVVNAEEIILIDTGLLGNSSKIADYVAKTLKRNLKDIKTIVITHYHFDHVGSLSKIKEITGGPKWQSTPPMPITSGGREKHVGGTFMNAIKLFQVIYQNKPVEPEILLQDGDVIGKYQVIHTPGHSPGSICLITMETRRYSWEIIYSIKMVDCRVLEKS